MYEEVASKEGRKKAEGSNNTHTHCFLFFEKRSILPTNQIVVVS